MKPVPGYEDRYLISRDGVLYSLKYLRQIGGYKNKDGYLCAVLTRNYKRWFVGIHRLVALAWIGDPGTGFEPNHKNGIRDDNRDSNLEWLTHKENCHPTKALFSIAGRARGEKNGAAKYSLTEIETVRALRKTGLTHMKIATETGISISHVGRVLRSENWAQTP